MKASVLAHEIVKRIELARTRCGIAATDMALTLHGQAGILDHEAGLAILDDPA